MGHMHQKLNVKLLSIGYFDRGGEVMNWMKKLFHLKTVIAPQKIYLRLVLSSDKNRHSVMETAVGMINSESHLPSAEDVTCTEYYTCFGSKNKLNQSWGLKFTAKLWVCSICWCRISAIQERMSQVVKKKKKKDHQLRLDFCWLITSWPLGMVTLTWDWKNINLYNKKKNWVSSSYGKCTYLYSYLNFKQ